MRPVDISPTWIQCSQNGFVIDILAGGLWQERQAACSFITCTGDANSTVTYWWLLKHSFSSINTSSRTGVGSMELIVLQTEIKHIIYELYQEYVRIIIIRTNPNSVRNVSTALNSYLFYNVPNTVVGERTVWMQPPLMSFIPAVLFVIAVVLQSTRGGTHTLSWLLSLPQHPAVGSGRSSHGWPVRHGGFQASTGGSVFKTGKWEEVLLKRVVVEKLALIM